MLLRWTSSSVLACLFALTSCARPKAGPDAPTDQATSAEPSDTDPATRTSPAAPPKPSPARLRADCDLGQFDACDALGEPLRPDPPQGEEDLELAEVSGRGDATGVARLLEQGHRGDATRNGVPVLHTALARSHWRVAELLLAAGANPNVLTRGVSRYHDDPALIVAVKNRGAQIVPALLDAGAKIDLPGARGSTALHEALQLEEKAIVRLLLDHGASPRVRASDGSSALELAVYRSDPDYLIWITQALGGLPKPPPDASFEPWLKSAAHSCRLENVEFLLARKVDPNARGPRHDDTALIRSAEAGCDPVVARLLRVPGIDLDAQDRRGLSALIAAAGNGHVRIVDRLVRAGADLSLRNAEGQTAIERAKDHGHMDAVRALQRVGASIDPHTDAKIDTELAERWRTAPSRERCKAQSDRNGRNTSVLLCVVSLPTEDARRFEVQLRDASTLVKVRQPDGRTEKQHRPLASTALPVDAGEFVDLEQTWATTLSDGTYLLFVAIGKGHPQGKTEIRNEVWRGRGIEQAPRRAWRSPPCSDCDDATMQMQTTRDKTVTLRWITRRGDEYETTVLAVERGRVGPVEAARR